MRSVWVLALGLVACSGEDAAYDYTSKGAALYGQLCQVCHGETGEGGLAPKLLDTKRSHAQLRETIAARMPANNPGQCTGECAAEIASFIKDGLTTSALKCDAVPPAPRRLRLLTRREYRATVRDLFGERAPVMACPRAIDCAFRDVCDAGTCEPSACDAQTFVYDPHGRSLSTVQVAGTFTNWQPTLSLAYAAGLWVGTFAIGEGTHQYKLVLNGNEWVADPRAPSTQPDGFGGNNSAFALSCAGGVARDALAKLPAENRPAGFPFDTDADSALVTAMHVDAYLAAAEQLADFAAKDLCRGDRATCVRDVGQRIFRRPLTNDEVASYASMDVDVALHAMLVSPSFLYRSELGEKRGEVYKLTGYEVATALSYTILGTTPSDALLAAANELTDAKGIEKHARALLADPRARDQIGEYVLQWTGGEGVLSADKRADLFPGFDDATRAALANETRAFAASVVFDGTGRLHELLTADYTILDATAAKFYGVVPGKVKDPDRAGLLGHASVLAATAHSDQTSPIRRGLFVRRNLLCQELPPPPPFAGGVPDVDPSATTRERFAMHTANAVCAGCHRYIDGVGFGLERFDPVGRWRTTEAGKPIDASGNMNDVEHLGTGTDAHYATLPELASIIANSKAAQSCFTRQYLRFARGMKESLAQRCGRLWIEQKFIAANDDVRELVIQAVLAPDFAVRREP